MPEKITSGPGLWVVVLIAALATFAGTVSYEYVWDDPSLVVRVQDALDSGQVTRLFTTSYHVRKARSARYFRPLMMGSLLGDVALTDGSPWFSHLVNVLIHGVNAVLVLSLLNLVLANTTAAVTGALLFAVHPVHAETVSVVSNRMDLMVLLLVFPAVLLWASPEDENLPRTGLMWLAASFSFLLACFAKETAFMLPLALISWQALEGKWPARKKVIGLVLLAAASTGALAARAAVFAREVTDSSQIKAGALLPDVTIGTGIKVFLVNLRLAVFPFPVRSLWMGGDLDPGTATLLSAAVFVLMAAWAMKRNFIPAAKGLAWWFIFTLPVLGLFHLGQTAAAERYAYIPSAGFCLLFGSLVASLPRDILGKRAFRAGVSLMIVVLGTWGAVHSLPFKNEIELFRHVARTNPGYPDASLNLGVALAREGRYEDALEAYDRALELIPDWDMAVFNRANLLHRMGRNEEALALFDRLLVIAPDDWEAYLNRGNVLAQLQRYDEAAGSYRESLALSGSSGKPLVGLGVLAAREGEFERSIDLFREAAERDPDLSEAFEGMAESYLALGRYAMAENAFLRALETSPGNARAALKMGWFLLDSGRPVQADSAFRTALAADPSLLEAWVGLIRSLDAVGQKNGARELIRELERSDPALALRVLGSLERGPFRTEER